jgi:hypothetical protein
VSHKAEPSARQHEVANAVQIHGSVAAAASILGIRRITVEATLARYHNAACVPRIAELEAELAIMRDREAAARAATRLEVVAGRLERLAVPVNHRRMADGGTPVREQRRHADREAG